MSRCDTNLLTAYIDGTLPPALAQRASDHLAACPSCARIVEEQTALKARLARHAAGIAIPGALSSRVSSAITQDMQQRPRSRWNRATRFGGPLVAVTAVAAGLWFARPTPPPLDVQAVVWQHVHAMNPPAGESLKTSSNDEGRKWLAARLGHPPSSPFLAAPLTGVGACHIGNEPTAIWMYRAAKPVTLIEVYASEPLPAWSDASCGTADRSSRAAGWLVGDAGGYNAVTWQAAGHTFALVSSMSKADMIKLLERSP